MFGNSDTVLQDEYSGLQLLAATRSNPTPIIGQTLSLLRTGWVDEAAHARTRQALGLQGVVDLTGLVGYYTLLAMTLNAHDVQPPAGATLPWNAG